MPSSRKSSLGVSFAMCAVVGKVFCLVTRRLEHFLDKASLEDCKYCIIAPTVELNLTELWVLHVTPLSGIASHAFTANDERGNLPVILAVSADSRCWMDDHHRSVAEGQRLKTGAVAPAGCVAPADTATQCRRHGGGDPTRHMTVRLCDGNAK